VGNESTKTFTVTDERTVSSNDIPDMITITPEDGDDDEGDDRTDEHGFHYRGRWVNGYTRGNVVIRIHIPDWLKGMLADKPFSWDDGMTWTDSPELIVTENGTYHLLIKLIDGTITRCPDIVINCIDREAPTLMVSGYGMKIYVYAKDEKCGLATVTVTDPDGRTGPVEGKTNDDGSFEAEITATRDGKYVITATDGLGNSTSREIELKTALIRIINPDEITGVANGTKKDAKALGLPEKVQIITNNPELTEADVKWDLDNLLYDTKYDPKNVDRQLFVVGGDVILPEYVDTTGVELRAQVSVTVDESKEKKITFSDDDGDGGTMSGNGIYSEKYGRGMLSVRMIKDSFVYKGTQIRPKVKLRYTYYAKNGKRCVKKLKENRDYTLTYEDNIDVGDATMTITGIGDFGGSIDKDFKIVPRAMQKVKVKGLKDIIYGTDPGQLHPTLKDRNRILIEGEDYTVSADSVMGLSLLGMRYQKITITVRAVDGGNYEGVKTRRIKIYKRSLNNPIAVSIEAKDIKVGEQPQVTVKYSGATLKEGRDYQIEYIKADRAGKATARITGHGNYSGKRSVTFMVTR